MDTSIEIFQRNYPQVIIHTQEQLLAFIMHGEHIHKISLIIDVESIKNMDILQALRLTITQDRIDIFIHLYMNETIALLEKINMEVIDALFNEFKDTEFKDHISTLHQFHSAVEHNNVESVKEIIETINNNDSICLNIHLALFQSMKKGNLKILQFLIDDKNIQMEDLLTLQQYGEKHQSPFSQFPFWLHQAIIAIETKDDVTPLYNILKHDKADWIQALHLMPRAIEYGRASIFQFLLCRIDLNGTNTGKLYAAIDEANNNVKKFRHILALYTSIQENNVPEVMNFTNTTIPYLDANFIILKSMKYKHHDIFRYLIQCKTLGSWDTEILDRYALESDLIAFKKFLSIPKTLPNLVKIGELEQVTSLIKMDKNSLLNVIPFLKQAMISRRLEIFEYLFLHYEVPEKDILFIFMLAVAQKMEQLMCFLYPYIIASPLLKSPEKAFLQSIFLREYQTQTSNFHISQSLFSGKVPADDISRVTHQDFFESLSTLIKFVQLGPTVPEIRSYWEQAKYDPLLKEYLLSNKDTAPYANQADRLFNENRYAFLSTTLKSTDMSKYKEEFIDRYWKSELSESEEDTESEEFSDEESCFLKKI